MVLGKTWMPQNATVMDSGNVIAKEMLSPSAASDQSEVFSDAIQYLKQTKISKN